VLKDILKWAGEDGLNEISEARFARAVGGKLTEEQQMIINGQVWGFISPLVSGSADTSFKGAGSLQGIDAWRIPAHATSHGKDIRIETLRRGMEIAVARPITGLDEMDEGTWLKAAPSGRHLLVVRAAAGIAQVWTLDGGGQSGEHGGSARAARVVGEHDARPQHAVQRSVVFGDGCAAAPLA
jgi:hypothetical protein